MSESSRSSKSSRAEARAGASRGMPSRNPRRATSVTRTALAAVLVVGGIAWIAVYLTVAQDGQQLTWMGDLQRWNFLIGFGALLLGLAVAAHPSTPLGRGRGVVAGMLGCFLLGLVWIVVYYMAADADIPLIADLQQYNLIVGIGFMAAGFVYATHWE